MRTIQKFEISSVSGGDGSTALFGFGAAAIFGCVTGGLNWQHPAVKVVPMALLSLGTATYELWGEGITVSGVGSALGAGLASGVGYMLGDSYS